MHEVPACAESAAVGDGLTIRRTMRRNFHHCEAEQTGQIGQCAPAAQFAGTALAQLGFRALGIALGA